MAIGEEMKSKYPGGEWKTINGHHVYLMENGEIAPETPLPGEDHSSKSNQHLAHDHAKLFDSITDWIDGLPDHPMTHDINMDNMQETFDMAQLAKQLQKKAKGEDFAIWVAKSDSDKFQKLSEYADKVLGVDSTDFMIQLYDSAQDKSNDQEGPGDDEEDLQVDDSYLDQDEAEPGIEPLLEEAKGYAQESKDINDFYDHLPEELSLKLIKHFNGDQDGFVKLFNEVKGIKKEPLQEFLDAHPKLSPLAKMALTHDAKEAQNYYEWQDMLLDSTFDELYNLAAQEATDGNLSETLKHMYTLGHGEPKADDYVTAPPKTPWGQVLQQAVGKTYSDWINNLSGDELDALVDYAYSHKPDGTEQHEYINKLYEDAQNGHYPDPDYKGKTSEQASDAEWSKSPGELMESAKKKAKGLTYDKWKQAMSAAEYMAVEDWVNENANGDWKKKDQLWDQFHDDAQDYYPTEHTVDGWHEKLIEAVEKAQKKPLSDIVKDKLKKRLQGLWDQAAKAKNFDDFMDHLSDDDSGNFALTANYISNDTNSDMVMRKFFAHAQADENHPAVKAKKEKEAKKKSVTSKGLKEAAAKFDSPEEFEASLQDHEKEWIDDSYYPNAEHIWNEAAQKALNDKAQSHYDPKEFIKNLSARDKKLIQEKYKGNARHAWKMITSGGTRLNLTPEQQEAYQKWSEDHEKRVGLVAQRVMTHAIRLQGKLGQAWKDFDLPALAEKIKDILPEHVPHDTLHDMDYLDDLSDRLEQDLSGGYSGGKDQVHKARVMAALYDQARRLSKQKPLSPDEAMDALDLVSFHGTDVPSAESIARNGFYLNGHLNDFGDAAYFKSPEWDEADHQEHLGDTKAISGHMFNKGAVMRVRLRAAKPEHVLDMSKTSRPPELTRLIQKIIRPGGQPVAQHEARKAYVEFVNGKEYKTQKEADEAFEALPAEKKQFRRGIILTSPYEMYAREKGIKVVIDVLDHWRNEGWQIGVYDPDLLEPYDVGAGIAEYDTGIDLDKAIKTDKDKPKEDYRGKPLGLIKHFYKDGTLHLDLHAHLGSQPQPKKGGKKPVEKGLKIMTLKKSQIINLKAEPKEDLNKGFGADMLGKYQGGRWVTLDNDQHVYIMSDGKIAPETMPVWLKAQGGNTQAAPDAQNQPQETPQPQEQPNTPEQQENPATAQPEAKTGQSSGTNIAAKKKALIDAYNQRQSAVGKPDAKNDVGNTQNPEQSSEPVASDQGATPPSKDAQPQGNASQGQEQPETAGEAQNSPAEASEPQEDTSTPPEEQNVPDEPLFPNTSTLQGEDGLNQLMKTYEQWQSQGSTHFDTVFPQFWNSVSMLQESGNPEAQKFHARIMNDGAGQPGAVSMTADTGNSLVLQYLETAPQHRASGKNKKRERGLGVRMVAQAIQDSIDKGYGGKVELTSLSMQATQKFYQSLGFERVSGLHYEISPEKAQALVEKVKGAYGANAQPAQMPKKGKKNLAVAAKALPTEPLGQDQDDDEDYPDLRYENQPEDLEAWKRQLEDLEDKLDGLIAGDVKGYVGSRLKKLNINGMPKLPEEGVMDNGRPEPDRGTGKGY